MAWTTFPITAFKTPQISITAARKSISSGIIFKFSKDIHNYKVGVSDLVELV